MNIEYEVVWNGAIQRQESAIPINQLKAKMRPLIVDYLRAHPWSTLHTIRIAIDRDRSTTRYILNRMIRDHLVERRQPTWYGYGHNRFEYNLT